MTELALGGEEMVSPELAGSKTFVDRELAEKVDSAAAASWSPVGVGADQLRSFVERIERLNEEKAALAADIREIYAEVKDSGFDTKAIRAVVRLRAMDKSDRDEQEAILELYAHALGL